MLKLSYKYMRYYKSQTIAILASMILTAALLTGIGSLMYSSQRSDLEHKKTIYGDWHYYMVVEPEVFQSVNSKEKESRFHIEQSGKMEIRDVVTEPSLIYFINTDESYRHMTHRELVKGNYPKAANEIAADNFTLGNLGFSGEIGDVLNINGTAYVLTGIVRSEWATSADEMQIFVGEDFVGRGSQSFLYLIFDENQKLYEQLDAFLQTYRISGDDVVANDEVVMYLGGEQPDSIYDIVKFTLTDENGNFTYLVLKLQSEYNLAFNGMILLLCLFSLFIIYSIFHISVSKRTSEYGMMQTLGISEKRIGGTLILELWMLFLIGYPIGCLLGNGILRTCYRQLDGVFANKIVGRTKTGMELSKTDLISGQQGAEATGFYVAWDVMIVGFVFLLITLAIVGFLTVHSMRKQSLRQVMSGDTSFIKRKRKIYSIRGSRLVNVVVRKFMFSSKKKVIGILLSLSIGGCIFLCTTYMVENLKIHAEMSMKSEDGLGSEYRISVKSLSLADTIPEATVKEIKNVLELTEVYATKYILGELTIHRNELEWKEYFDQMNQEDSFIAAIVSRALAQENSYLNIEPWSNVQSFIMTNQQMSNYYGISDYSFINASPIYGADTEEVSKQLLIKIQDVPKTVLQDYTTAIETQKNYLQQQQLFFSGIAIILLVISLFHIMNSMNYSILARRREYGIIRAMGITDTGFYKMILKTGITYGLLADIFLFMIYHVVLRKVMDYYMAHIAQFLHFTADVPNGVMAIIMLLNLMIAVATVMIPARKIVRGTIISEIGR